VVLVLRTQSPKGTSVALISMGSTDSITVGCAEQFRLE
jgi:hypothetical protein